MSRTTHHRISLLALTGLGLGAILVPSNARAENGAAAVMQLAKGEGGKEVTGKPKKNAEPGTEQSVATSVVVGGKTYIVTVYMSADVTEANSPNELKCSSVMVDPITGPVLVANQIQITSRDGNNGNSDRPANHPKIAHDEKGNIVFLYGSDNNNGNVQTMAGVVDNMCVVQSKPIVISRDNNQNSGAPDIKYAGNGYFLSGYLEGGNNVRAVGLQLTGTTLTKNFDKNVINPCNIGRPTIAMAGPDKALFCAAKGDNRPPEDGIACGFINAIDGTILVKQTIVAASNPDAGIYMNQPTVEKIAPETYAMTYQESQGGGKNKNLKGSNLSHMMVLKANEAGFQMLAQVDGLAASATHSSLCTTSYGKDGNTAISIMAAPPTGVGVPTLSMVFWDAAKKQIVDEKGAVATPATTTRWTVGYAADSGLLANIYGQNPNTQGRDFLTCTGDVANPGHGVKGGYQSNVASFVLAPHSGRNPGESKNALFLSLVPSKTDAPVVAQQPTSLDPAGANATKTPPPATPDNPPVAPPPPVQETPDPSGGGTHLPLDTTQPAGCACSVPGSTNSSGEAPLAALAALGLAVAMISRRKES